MTSDLTLITKVKHQLHRKALYQALGQVLLYRTVINPAARAAIVGYGTEDTPTLAPLIERLGVEVQCWDDRDVEAPAYRAASNTITDEGEGVAHGVATNTITDEDEVPAYGVATNTITNEDEAPHDEPAGPRTFRWRVAELAQSQGVKNPAQLATRLHMDRQSLYGPWKGEARQISLATLGQLAHALGVEAGDWFVWEPAAEEGQPPQLRWNIAGQAAVRGFSLGQLYFEARVAQTSLTPIWRGTQRAVSPAVLARLAHALDRPGQPFSIGELFAWEGAADEPGRQV